MTRSIREILATLPSGEQGLPLGDAELGRYLAEHYGTQPEKDRMERHRLRDELYRDGGCDHMRSVVDDVFQHDKVRELRRKWVPHARFSNALRNIVGQTSSVYQEPATRKVGGADSNQKKFDELSDAVMLDEVMDHANRMLNLHRAIIIGPRIRLDDGDPELVIDVLTPANVIAVVHPNDTTKVIAWVVRQSFRSARTEWPRAPVWQLWSAREVMFLDRDFVPVTSREHGLGINPWVSLTYSAEAVAGFWPGEEGEDLVSAQIAIWMAHILLMKETKSATKKEIVSGDASTMARGQPSDTDVPTEAPEGVSVTTVDMSMDTSIFTGASDHALERAGNNYGIALAALKNQGVQSAEARESMNEPLRKIRRTQIKTFRRAERRLVYLIARVVEVDAPSLSFKVDAFSVNFGEPQVLVAESERLVIYEKKKALGFDNPVDYYRKYVDPDCESDAAALNAIARNVEMETLRVAMLKEQMAMSGALGATAARADSGETANGGRPLMSAPGATADLSWVEELIDAA